MNLENLALTNTYNLPIRHEGPIHEGKVRAVYWLTKEDSSRLIDEMNYNVAPGTELGLMIISDKISAFECGWQAEGGLNGVPGKGANLNATSEHWYDIFEKAGIAGNHIVDTPHPMVWLVQRANPTNVEWIIRNYNAGSIERAIEKGERYFYDTIIGDNIKKSQKFDKRLITPSTKGTLYGIPGVPEEDDVNLNRGQIIDNYKAFGLNSLNDLDVCEMLTKNGFELISEELDALGYLLVDTKFELGYIVDKNGKMKLIFIDEVGTPDSSRYWPKKEYEQGIIVEKSKEGFRKFLLNTLDKNILTDKTRMPERKKIAGEYKVPVSQFMEVSDIYTEMREQITGTKLPAMKNPREEIITALDKMGLIVDQ